MGDIFEKFIKKIYKLTTVIIITFLFPPIYSWDLKKEKNGVRVFTRAIEGSNFKEFKSVGIHTGSISSLISVLQDDSNFCNWFPDCKEFKLLKKPSKLERYQYMVVKAPFPVSNRDTIQHTILSQDFVSKTVLINLSASPETLPEVQGTIRIPKSRGFWKFTPLDNNQVEVTFQLHSDPGGTLPEWVANIFVTETPLKAVLNLIKLAGEDKYRSNKLEYIIEK
jgi:ribosome-associated toxin RatA of RatAB toxin-antitoxin module